MSDPDPQDPSSRAALLREVAARAGDPALFPAEVLDLYARWKFRRARRVLLRHAKRYERDADRATRQREAAADLRLWLDPSDAHPLLTRINGIGTTLLGAYQRAQDGTSIATQWLTVLFVPLWPVAAYSVAYLGGREWRVFGRVPLPPVARTARWVAGALTVAGAVAIAASAFWEQRHTDLFVFNGFDRPAVVQVGAERRAVPARHAATFSNIVATRTRLEARWPDGSEPFEALDIDLRGHGSQRIIYNVAGRAVLGLYFVVYGDGAPHETQLLDPGPVLFLERQAVHFLFQTPPESIAVSTGATNERAVLDAMDAVENPVRAIDYLHTKGRSAQALKLARAELLAHPENAPVAYYASSVLLRADTAAQRALFRACLDRAPDEVDLHRSYQDVFDWDSIQLRREYRALYEQHPRSPMYRYLLGRSLNDTAAAAKALFQSALALDSGYAPAWRALAYAATVRGDLVAAVGYYDRLASLGPDLAASTLETQLRLRRRLHWDPGEAERVILAAAARSPDTRPGALLRAHLRIERAPAAFDREVDTLVAELLSLVSPDLRDVLAPNFRASLAITAGRLEVARAALRGIETGAERDLPTTLRLVLSAGAQPDDQTLLTEIPDWFTQLSMDDRLMALELLNPPERAAATRVEYPGFGEIVAALDDEPGLIRGGVLDTLLNDFSPAAPKAYFAAARRLGDHAEPRAGAARERYLARAWSFSLPGELPYFRR